MSSIWMTNLKSSWRGWVFLFGATFIPTRMGTSHVVNHEVFGKDGNGGSMIKIITDLTDEEIATLKFTKRLHWHMPSSIRHSEGRNLISDQELSDRGIELPQEKYIEYNKRPPHDKFL